jgi:hypothetical protein
MSALTWPNGTPVTQAEWDEMKRRDAAEHAADVLERGRFNIWRDLEINLAGSRVTQFGDWLVKLGYRIQGDPQIGIDETFVLGETYGQIDAWKAGGRVAALLTAMLEHGVGLHTDSLTPEELAAETTMTADRVRELLGNAIATQDELQQISTGIFAAHRAQFDAHRAQADWASYVEGHSEV